MNNTKKEIKLSSKLSTFSLYGGSILVLAIVPILVLTTRSGEISFRLIFTYAFFLAMVAFMIYLFKHTCSARVVGDQIVLKKQFRPAKSYSFDKIGYPRSFRLRSTKYTTFKMKNTDNTTEKFLIMNSRSFLAFEKKDAEELLLLLRDQANPLANFFNRR